MFFMAFVHICVDYVTKGSGSEVHVVKGLYGFTNLFVCE